MELIDTHAHLDFPRFKEDRDEVIKRAATKGVKYIVNVGADLVSSRRSLEMSRDYPDIFATVGVHPHDADKLDGKAVDSLRAMAGEERVVAIGEIGLDYYYDNSPRERQQEALRVQLRLARETGLPVVIHNRESDQDMLKILKEEKVKEIGGIFHCFSSNQEVAREVLDMNLYLAFGGVITFKNAGELREVVRSVPLERILLETDSPYLTPHPYRGKRNEPAYVSYVAQKVAELKGISLEEVARVTTRNAIEVYGLSTLLRNKV